MAPNSLTPSPPMRIAVKVMMDAPSFHPGAVVSATVSLHAKHNVPFQSSQSLRIPPTLRPTLAFSASTTPTVGAFAHPGVARVEYVIVELSGRWNSDRAWVVPDAHAQANPSIHLDNHTKAPISTSASQTVKVTAVDPKLDPYPWSVVLADANAIGGGGRTGHSGIIFRSQPLVVCEDEQIPAESEINFAISAVLPDSIPPTLRGSSMRYVYALLVVVKFPGDPMPRQVRVPFRVLPTAAPSLGRYSYINQPIAVPTPRDVGPRPNRFLQSDEATALSMSCRLLKSTPPDDIEIALALSMNGRLTDYNADVEQRRFAGDVRDSSLVPISQNISPTVRPSGLDLSSSLTDDGSFAHKADGLCVYSVSRGPAHVARLYMSKRVHHLGDSVSIMFHFQDDSPCYRIGARLEAQEVVNAKFSFGHEHVSTAIEASMAIAAAGASDSPSEVFPYGSNVGGNYADDGTAVVPHDGVVFRKDYGEYGEVVTATRNTEVTFSIPHDAPASFSTGAVSIRWLIQFMFIVPKAKSLGGSQEGAVDCTNQKRIRNSKFDDENREYDSDEITPLSELKGNGCVPGKEDDGWRGGPWAGENPQKWKHLPEEDVDVLKWTLPIVVSGQPDSQWGTRSAAEIVHVPKS